jgi:hypothetical protein
MQRMRAMQQPQGQMAFSNVVSLLSQSAFRYHIQSHFQPYPVAQVEGARKSRREREREKQNLLL